METNSEFGAVERRSGKDRRSRRFGDFRWFLKTGRRRQVRRQSDRRRLHQLDFYSPKMFYLIVLVLLLSVADALLTLHLIDLGAVEMNPVMAYYLELGPRIFMLIKYLITAAVVIMGVLFNYAHIRFFKVQFGKVLNVSAGCFALVVMWELYLLYQLNA